MDNTENIKSESAKREEAVLKFWKENNIFEKSLKKDSPKGNYVFYDGPPFATGLPHYGHILGSTAKDVIGRYKTMQGFTVPRRWGWDCHGLPIENIVEKDLKVSGHVEIEALGVEKFVEYARSKVLTYVHDWKKTVDRIGRWVDFDGGYKTMDNTFIESVWWSLGEMNKKGLLYEGVRVLAYCPRCETPIANSEIAMDNSYKDITDISVYVKFELVDEPDTYLLAWTTTPWTLPGNTAIAINKDIVYVKVKIKDSKEVELEGTYIVAKDSLVKNFPLKDGQHTYIIEEFKGEKLIGKKYKPVFSYYENTDMPNKENIWKIWHADFVTIDKGTGIAHEAPAFGEDDMNLAKEHNIPWIIHVDETGRFKPEVTDFAGMQVKPKPEEKDGQQKTDIEVIKYLAHQSPSLLFAKEKIVHSYPHCYRCETPLFYYALPSWFVNIQKAKKEILAKAENINWIPSHLKEGRFKNNVQSAPDWNISRNRYWASPLPIWKSPKGEILFVNSLEDLKNKTKKSGNKYFVMRHGEAENNVLNVYSSDQKINKLTEKGRNEVLESAKNIKDKKITQVFCSPFLRTKETAEIVAEQIGFPKDKIIYDDRIRELEFGEFSDRSGDEYWDYCEKTNRVFDTRIPGGESYQDAKNRMGAFLYEIDQKYKDETILIVSHGIAVEIFPTLVEGADKKRSLEIFNSQSRAEPASLHEEHEFISLPHNANFELDLHRPYIDELVLINEKGEDCRRIPEVIDCWFESGSMPFAQDHYPFANPDWHKKNFPAGFVAEYIAQTRTWFYYTHAISTILFGEAPFENVVTTGTLLAADGQKMSKSKGNYPDPWILFDKYGVDPLRLYLMSSPLMKGEDANFLEKSVQDLASKFIGRFFNVVAFYELYRDKNLKVDIDQIKSENVLDKWIIARFYEVVDEVTQGMEAYDMSLATRPLELFVDDLSTWYLRRSRDRIKDGDKEAKQTLYFILKNFAKIISPFTPFAAEDVWLKLRNDSDVISVHLAEWPNESGIDLEIIDEMKRARETVSVLLKERQQKNIPVRQPLASGTGPAFSDTYIEIIKDEVNIKNYQSAEVIGLDMNITPELKIEGNYRELVRAVQDMRKKSGLTPSDVISLVIETNDIGKKLVEKFEADMKKTVLASKIEFSANEGEEIKVDELVFKVKLNK